MFESLKQNKILVIVFAVVSVLFMWSMLSKGGDTTSHSLLVSTTQSAPRSEIDQEIVRLLLDMRSLRLDGSVFTSPGFILLHDFSREIVSEPQGRPNPFAPISSEHNERNTDE